MLSMTTAEKKSLKLLLQDRKDESSIIPSAALLDQLGGRGSSDDYMNHH